MDGQQFDGLARTVTLGLTRRRALRAMFGAMATMLMARIDRVDAAFPICAEDGEACTLWVRCCRGLVCATSLLNPNAGVCRHGSGSTVAAEPPSRPPRQVPLDEPPASTEGSFTVEVDCDGKPESTTVTNTGDAPITVESVSSIDQPREGKEPYPRDDTLSPGESIAYQSGPEADAGAPTTLTNESIFDDTAGSAEGVRVTTTAGRGEDRCADARRRSARQAQNADRRKHRRRR